MMAKGRHGVVWMETATVANTGGIIKGPPWVESRVVVQTLTPVGGQYSERILELTTLKDGQPFFMYMISGVRLRSDFTVSLD